MRILFKFLYPIVMFIWSLYNLEIATYIYTGSVVALSLYLLFMDSIKIYPNPETYSYSEIEVLKKYHIYFQYPFASRILSATLNTFRWSAFLWTPWLFWNHFWFSGSLLLANFIFLGGLSIRLDPIFFLSYAVNQGKYEFANELNEIKSLYEKIYSIEKN